MNKESKPGSREQIRRNNGFRKMLTARRQADYWRKRWETHPESMRSNLEALNRTRKEKAAQRTQRLLLILGKCPDEMKSWELRPTMLEAIRSSGFAVTPTSSTVLLSALRRRRLISFDPERLVWKKVIVA